jgi:hypothetical protein
MDDLDKAGDETLVPDAVVARLRYRVNLRTIKRWSDDPRLNFPKAFKVGSRCFRRLGELRAWERDRAAGRVVTAEAEVAHAT